MLLKPGSGITRIAKRLSLLPLALAGCGLQEVVDSERVHPLDGVKLVRASVASPTDPSTIGRPEYLIDSDSRLLMRLESLQEHADEIRTDEGYSLKLVVTPIASSASGREEARARLQLCALARNWMMLATWKRGHPFDATGKWSTPGGDYDSEQCFSPELTEEGLLVFTVTPWFVMEVRGRGRNYGFVLMASAPVTIRGDGSSAQGPWLQWTQSSAIIYPRRR